MHLEKPKCLIMFNSFQGKSFANVRAGFLRVTGENLVQTAELDF